MNVRDLMLETIALSQIDFMRAIRESLDALLVRDDIQLGVMDLVEGEKSIIISEGQTYYITGGAWRKDKTKAVKFSKEFRANIGFETGPEDVSLMVNDLYQDILLALSREDSGVSDGK